MRKERLNINYRKILLVLFDVIAIQIVSLLCLFVRFDFSFKNIPLEYAEALLNYAIVNTVLTVAVFIFFKLYRSVWRLASVKELINIVLACCVATGLQICIMTLAQIKVPRSYHFLFFVFLIIASTCIRFSYRILRIIKNRVTSLTNRDLKRVMIVGAGMAGEIILKEIESGNIDERVICLIDDNPAKWGKYLRGVEIVGGRMDIPACVSRYSIDEIIFAIPSISNREKKIILGICNTTSCEVKTLPGLYQLVTGEVSVDKLRKVQIEDLLGREQVGTQIESIMNYVEDKTVLVTGGGGSIGSELCRQIAAHNPKKLIILDIYENNAYDIQMELVRNYYVKKHRQVQNIGKCQLDLEVVIASVRDKERIEQIFEQYKPDLVYHAAAHKHVPLMEDSPAEAIKNNVLGTLNVAKAADKYGTKRFVLISTDKAVNPTNIMGATKRMCEMIVQTMNEESNTEYVAVRFGNVLGSNGSVIPLFRKQIEEGGPVTVTHPDVIRYFMTIPEAVSLVLQAGAFAKGGEIFVLDMGEPVKIVDLAKNLIRLSGFSEEDIHIQFTGLRPGEKLFEEMLMKEEGLQETENKQIYIGKPIEFNRVEYKEQLGDIEKVLYDENVDIKLLVSNIVTTYKYNEK